MVDLDGRDRHIVQLVARFKQLSSAHIDDLLFDQLSSRTPCIRALRRLTEQKYLARIERRIVGGKRGGSGQYVYQLGRRGFYMIYEGGRYQPARAVNYHSLAVADCYVRLKELERQGHLQVVAGATEPDCHVTIAGVILKPDLFVELAKPSGERLKVWLEMDMGSEAQRQLRAKLDAYYRAWSDADVKQWPVFPKTVWVGVDDERAKELAWLIGEMKPDAQQLFKVTTRDNLTSIIS